MNCFPCFKKKDSGSTRKKDVDEVHVPIARQNDVTTPPPPVNNNLRQAPLADTTTNRAEDNASRTDINTRVKTYTLRELAAATKNFRPECLLGEGAFGRVFKGSLTPSGETVAIRQLDRNGAHGGKEFAVEISKLSLLTHPNLVKIIGYCADGDQRLLVYEYMPSGSLKNHLFGVQAGKEPLNWSSRMKIALGIAEGLEFLHEKTNPPIIYRDLKSSNILLDSANNPSLSEYGLAKLVQSGNSMHVSPRVIGANGYCAPEYERHGELTLKSDVYSFGVVLLELITGRVAMDTARPAEEQNLVSWAQPTFRDPSRFPDMADPLLRKHFPVTSLNQAVGVAAMCLQEEPSARPLISDISAALGFLAMAPPEAPIPARLLSILSGRVSTSSQFGDNMNSSRLSTSSLQGDNINSSRISTSNESSDHIHSLGESYISNRQNDDNTYNSDISDDSDDEERENTANGNRDAGNKSRSGFNEVKTLGLSSKCNSKKSGASQGNLSRSSSRNSSSIRSRDYSIGNSLRSDSNFKGRSNNTSKQGFQDYDDSSSGDEELSNQRSHSKIMGINSRNGSRRGERERSMSSKYRQESLASSYSYSSLEDEDEDEDEYDKSNDRPETDNSRNNSIVNQGSGDQNTNKDIADSGSGYKGQDRSTTGSASVQKVESLNNVRSVSKVKSGVNEDKVRKSKSGVTRRP